MPVVSEREGSVPRKGGIRRKINESEGRARGFISNGD